MTITDAGDDAHTLTHQVIRSLQNTPDARTKTILTSLVHHLHDFVRDIEPSLAEWATAIGFLTEVGLKCDPVRQEFVLLSDVLGVSMLVETINDQQAPGATDGTVLGPFHMTESPRRQLGDTIDEVEVPTSFWLPERSVAPRANPSRMPPSTCGSATRTASTTSSNPTSSLPATGAASSPPTPRVGSGSAR